MDYILLLSPLPAISSNSESPLSVRSNVHGGSSSSSSASSSTSNRLNSHRWNPLRYLCVLLDTLKTSAGSWQVWSKGYLGPLKWPKEANPAKFRRMAIASTASTTWSVVVVRALLHHVLSCVWDQQETCERHKGIEVDLVESVTKASADFG